MSAAQKVDVLRVMDEAARGLSPDMDTNDCAYLRNKLNEARAAAAELIEAAKECELLLADLENGGAENPELNIIRTALARIGRDA